MITIRVNEHDEKLIRDYASFLGISVSDLMRQTVLERIEDEIDLRAYEQAKAAFDADPVTYSLDEVKKELGLTDV